MSKDVKPKKPAPAPKQGPIKIELAKEEVINIELSPAEKKKKNKAYIGIAITAFLIVLPIVLRLDPNYEPKMIKVKKQVAVPSQITNCHQTIQNEDHRRIYELRAEHVDKKVQKLVISYTFNDPSNNVSEDLDEGNFDLVEYNEISKIKSKAIAKETEGFAYKLTIDFASDSSLYEEPALAKHV